MYKKLTIILSIIIIILSVALINVKHKLKTLTKNNTTIVEVDKEKDNTTASDNKDSSSDDSNSEKFYNKLETVVKDNTNDIEGLSAEDNKLVRETVLKFLNGYAHYLDIDNLSFDNRMQSRVYDLKDIMMPDVYENTRLVVEGECMHMGDNFMFRWLKGVNIYEAKKDGDKVYINVGTKSVYFDFAMDVERTNEELGDSQIDYKFTLIKDNGTWKIENFQESYK